MKFRNLVAAAAALSLTATPVLAQSAASDVGRAVAPVAQESEVEGVSSIVWIIGAIVVGLGLYFIIDDDDDKPASP